MLHPVGPLPAAVYWRRRFLVLALMLSVFGGGGWLGFELLAARDGGAAGDRAQAEDLPTPRLEQVVPSTGPVEVASVEPVAGDDVDAAAEPPGPCTDEMIGLEVRTPGTAAVGSKPTLELVVVNTSAVPCVRDLDKALQELVLVDAAGARLWGSNDCFPETTVDVRTLAAGETASFPLVWGGLTSEPTCAAPRVQPPPGAYAVRGRLDSKISADAPLTLR